MKITYFGHACFKVESDTLSFVFDPFKDIGYDMKKTSADIVFCSHSHFDHNATERVQSKRVIDSIIEEELNDIKISTLSCFHDEVKGAKRGINYAYKVVANDTTFVHLGDAGEITSDVIDFVKNTDILFIPVGGTYTIDSKQAKELIEKSNAKYIIPMHYKTEKSNINITPLSTFTCLFDKVNYLSCCIDINQLKKGINILQFDK